MTAVRERWGAFRQATIRCVECNAIHAIEQPGGAFVWILELAIEKQRELQCYALLYVGIAFVKLRTIVETLKRLTVQVAEIRVPISTKEESPLSKLSLPPGALEKHQSSG